MKKLLTVFTLLYLVIAISISGCSEQEPILPNNVSEKIINHLGYALAPTWLPKSFEYAGPFPKNIMAFSSKTMLQSYGKNASAAIGDMMIMSYPTTDTIPSSHQEMIGLVTCPQ